MSHDQQHLERTEQLLVEHRNADLAGVFRATRVDARALLDTPISLPSPIRKFKFIATSLAACLALAVTTWGWFTIGNLGNRPGHSGMSVKPKDAPGSSEKNPFVNCLTGPLAHAGGTPCDLNDADGDGDIDLADFSLNQVHEQS